MVWPVFVADCAPTLGVGTVIKNPLDGLPVRAGAFEHASDCILARAPLLPIGRNYGGILLTIIGIWWFAVTVHFPAFSPYCAGAGGGGIAVRRQDIKWAR